MLPAVCERWPTCLLLPRGSWRGPSHFSPGENGLPLRMEADWILPRHLQTVEGARHRIVCGHYATKVRPLYDAMAAASAESAAVGGIGERRERPAPDPETRC